MRGFTQFPMIAALAIIAIPTVGAQQRRPFFQQTDANNDSSITRDEFKAAMATWLGGKASITQEPFSSAIEAAFPESAFLAMISPPQSRTPKPEDVQKMMAALPTSAPAKPAKLRKLLVLSTCAGFIHAAIPLAAKTMEELGAKTGPGVPRSATTRR